MASKVASLFFKQVQWIDEDGDRGVCVKYKLVKSVNADPKYRIGNLFTESEVRPFCTSRAFNVTIT